MEIAKGKMAQLLSFDEGINVTLKYAKPVIHKTIGMATFE